MAGIADKFHISGRAIGGRGGFIPGTSGKRIPGSAKLPGLSLNGLHLTNIRSDRPYSMSSETFREYHFRQLRDVRGQFAGGWGFAWQGLEAVNNNLIKANEKLHENLEQRAEQLKDEMVAYAQANAPWTDQTGDARAGLQGAVVFDDPDHFTIFLGHGAEIYYGIWLEVRWGGRYAIILPTIQAFAPQIAGMFRGGPS